MRKQKASEQPARKGSKAWKRIKYVLCIGFILAEVAFILGSFEAARRLQMAAQMVPELPDLMAEMTQRPSRIYSSDGVLLYAYQSKYRAPIRRIDVPKTVVDAILAAEDKRFYTHGGVDFRSLGRIAVEAALEERPTGASTLTMQLAKRVYTSNERSIERKLKDMSLAVMIERMLTKDQILELYLNQVYFGEGAYGIKAAADVYFDKSLDELTVAEAALLARCVRLPSTENPFANLDKAIENRNVVLGIMHGEGWISDEVYQASLNEEVKLRKTKPQIVTAAKKAPYFVDYVLAVLKKKDIDFSQGGYEVYTTLNYSMQTTANEEIDQALKRFGRRAVNQMAFMATDNKGEIKVMIGGPDYEKSEFNMIWMAPGRQPGSSFKPIVYATAIELGAINPRGSISTAPFYINDNGHRRQIKGGSGRGHISITSALASSNNTAAVRVQQEVGTGNVTRLAENAFGLVKSRLPEVPTLALGVGEVYMLEMAGAYSVFQSHGTRYPAYGIRRIEFPNGSVRKFVPAPARNVISPDTAETMDIMLRTVVTSGTGRAASGVINARGKTGTTSDHKDAWFVGYTDTMIGLMWMGHEEVVNGKPVAVAMRGVFGGEAAAPTWARIMKKLQKVYHEESRSFGRIRRVEQPDPEPEEEEIEIPPEDAPDSVPDRPGVNEVILDGTNDQGEVDTDDPGNGTQGGTKPPKTDDRTNGSTSSTGGTGEARDVVYVSVCADSGQRATIYCPEAVKRPFVKGTEPKGSCPVHGPHH